MPQYSVHLMADLVHIHVLLQTLLNNYFSQSRCILIVTHHDNAVELHSHTEIPIISTTTDNGNIRENVIFQHHGCQDIMIRHEEPLEIFIQFEHLIKIHHERFNTRRYVFLQGRNSSRSDVMDVLVTKEANYVSDILIIVEDECENSSVGASRAMWGNREASYSLMTHSFHNDSELLLLDIWFSKNSSFLFGADLFPNKLWDQQGKNLRIGTAQYEPFVVIDEETGVYAGIELSYAMEFVKKHNATVSIIKVTDDDPWGAIHDNWTGYGVLGLVAEDKADIAFAAIYTWERPFLFADYTHVTGRSGVTNLVPAPKLASGHLIFLYSFSANTWIALVMTFLFSIAALFLILQLGENRMKNCSHSAAGLGIAGNADLTLKILIDLYVGETLNFPNRRFLRCFIALALMQAVLVSTSYSSGLATVMTIPRYVRSIKTVEDLGGSGLLWGGTTPAWLNSLGDVKEEKYIKIIKNFQVRTEEELAELSKTYKFGFVLERATFGRPAIGSYVGKDVVSGYRLMDDIYWGQCILMIRKSSVLLPLLNRLILRIVEAGLPYVWEEHAAENFMDSTVQRVVLYYSHKADHHPVTKLQWTHVEGPFTMLVLGHTLASLCFVIEIIMNFLNIRKRF